MESLDQQFRQLKENYERMTEGELAAYLTAQRAAAGEGNPSDGVGLMVHGIIAAHDADRDGVVALADLAP